MAAAWPDENTRSQFCSIALGVAVRDQNIADCTMMSKLVALNECCRLALIPDRNLGHAYLVPFTNRRADKIDGEYPKEVQLIIGYKGRLLLARRSGHVTVVETGIVYTNDHFIFQRGSHPLCEHTPHFLLGKKQQGDMLCVWGTVKMRGEDARHIDCMSMDEIMKIKRRAKSSSRPNSPWNEDFDEMARKTMSNRLMKMHSASAVESRAEWLQQQADDDLPQFGTPELLTETIVDGEEATPAQPDSPE